MAKLRPDQTVPVYQPVYPSVSQRWVTSNEQADTANAAATDGRVLVYPMWVAPGTYDAMGVELATAQSGGATTCTLGVYPDGGTGDAPNTTSGPVVSVSPVLTTVTASNNSLATFASNWVVPVMAKYWMAFFYKVTTAPTTVPSFKCFSTVTYTLSTSGSLGISTKLEGWQRLTQTALPAEAFSFTNWTSDGNADIPLIGIRRA